jgi:hypothetical protein
MSYQKIQKVRIPRSDLPAIDPGGSYFVRFRIVSDDNNTSSHWSWVFQVLDEEGKQNVLDGGEVV